MIKRTLKHVRENRKLLNEINERLINVQSQNAELLFADYFRDSIQNSKWVTDKGFSAFGGAANYSLLYKLYKIYDIVKPQNVLEFGLGQTTKLSYQYAEANPNVKIIAIDDNKDWTEIYKKQITMPKNLNITSLALQDFRYKGEVLQKLNEYKGLNRVIGKTKFDLVIVDGPIGYDKEYSRTNIVSLSDSLAEDFIVIFDDAERIGEQRTINIFKQELAKNNVGFEAFDIAGSKTQHYIVASSVSRIIHLI